MVTYYTPLDIQVLRGLESVRKRPGMYVGNVDGDGLYVLIWNLVDHAVELARTGTATKLEVTLEPDSWITVRDDGPGLPIHLIDGTAALERLFTTLSAGNRFQLPGFHHPITNALSDPLVVQTTQQGEAWTQTYARGVAATELMSLGPSSNAGTTIRFRPDPTIFPSIAFDPAVIAERLQTLAWLTPQLAISWQGERLLGTRGLAGWAEHLCGGLHEAQLALHCPADPEAQGDTPEAVAVDVALAWRGDGDPIVRAFVNTISAPQGPHVEGLWNGITALAPSVLESSIGDYAARTRLARGLVAIVRVTLQHPQFANQTKEILSTVSARPAVERALASAEIAEPLRRFLLSRLL